MTRRIDKPDTNADIELKRYLDAGAPTCFSMVAGAGSGKTTSLVKALDHIATSFGDDLRRRSQQVACITYTEIAAKEIWGDVGNNSLFHVSTIHSFLWTIVKSFQKDIASWVSRRIAEKITELQNKITNYGSRTQEKTKEKDQRELHKLHEQQIAIRKVKSFNYGSGSDFAKGLLGHDDIIKMVPWLITNKEILPSLVAKKYPFCFVDESQDTFPNVVDALKEVARVMSGKFCLGFFGDPMQQIYTSGVGTIPID